MSSAVVRRQKNRKAPSQPLDRHLAEIGELDGSTYINVGIDSTCCKKRGRTIHKLTNGIMVSSPSSQTATSKRTLNSSSDDFASELSNDSSNDDQFDSLNSQCCSHCGK